MIGHSLPRPPQSSTPLDIILTVGYCSNMSKASQAARELAKRSIRARREKWGEKEFVRRMREWGKLGGRPRKEGKRDAN